MKYLAGGVLSFVVIVAIAGMRSPSPLQGRTPGKTLVAQPQHWVPFEADIVVTNPGAVTIYGHYYRARDGSHRWDTSGVRNTVRVSSINNLQQGVHYVTNPNGWGVYPLDLPAEGWQPSVFAIPSDMPGLRKLASRVFVNRDGQLVAVSESDKTHGTNGFQAYRHVNAQGMTCVLVPELNFFPILCQDLMTGKRTAYWNIRLDVDPSPSLFQPPPGANIEPETPPVADHLSHGAGMAQEVLTK